MTTVNLEDLDSALEWVSTDYVENLAYVCRDTGKIYWISGEPGVLLTGWSQRPGPNTLF